MSHNFFDLSGKIALVTGTSRGLGQYFARALARAGADIAMTSRDVRSLAPFADEIEALGRRSVSVALDVRDVASIGDAVAEVERGLGSIDILVNNAGCNIRKQSLQALGGISQPGTGRNRRADDACEKERRCAKRC